MDGDDGDKRQWTLTDDDNDGDNGDDDGDGRGDVGR